jgi:ribosomal 30S subunit maturation factor RimM
VVDKSKQYFIPATKDVIKEISLEKGCITIDASLLEGLLD